MTTSDFMLERCLLAFVVLVLHSANANAASVSDESNLLEVQKFNESKMLRGPRASNGSSEIPSQPEVSQVLEKGKQLSSFISQTPRIKVALALQGGGFLAFSSFTGILAALLSVKINSSNAEVHADLNASGLLSRIQAISCVSGGSWFATQLIYTDSFVNLIESIASFPDQASNLFDVLWMSKLVQMGSESTRWGWFVQTAAGLFGTAARSLWQTFVETTYFWQSGRRWQDFVERLLTATSNLDADLSLGASVQAWAANKHFLIGSSVVLGNNDRRVTLVQSLNALVYYKAHAAPGNTLPIYIPAKFSVTLGAGYDQTAPFPFVPSSAYSVVDSWSYSAEGWFWSDTASATGLQGTAFTSMTAEVGKMRVVEVTAASSAALGGVSTTKWLSKLATLLNVELTPWVSSQNANLAFKSGSILVDRARENQDSSSLQSLAEAKVHGLIDGAYTDNTGIANAVASGADDVIAFLCGPASTENSGLLQLFQGSYQGHDIPGIELATSPIFSEPYTAAQQQYAQLTALRLAEQNQRLLTSIKVGTILATTTSNKWYDISSGRKIKIHIVSISTDMGVGFFQDFLLYNQLVQEIVSTIVLPSNVEIVKSKVLMKLLSA